MLTSASWFTRLCPRLLSLLLFITISACSDHSTSITTQSNSGFGIPLPQAIATVLPGNGKLFAYLRVDGGGPQPMTIIGDSASITLNGLSLGQHNFTIEYEFALADQPNTPLMLASANKPMNIVAGQNTLDFSDILYKTDYDYDKDGISNLTELANNTNPFVSNVPGVNIGTLSGNGHTNESGGSVTFSLQLNTQPSGNVTINLSSSNLNEGTVSPSSVVFTTSDWNQAQTITVTGVDDPVPVADGPQTYTITLSKLVSSDANYNQLNSNDITVINDDNESTPSILLSFDKAAINEAMGTATLTATASIASTKEIVVTLGFRNSTASMGIDYTVTASSITIPPGNTTGTSVITAVQDDIPEGDETVVVDMNSVTNGIAIGVSPTLTVIDDDYSVGGSVTGYTGAGLVLQNNASDYLSVTGALFTFPVGLTSGSGYKVAVLTQPTAEYCTVANAVGSISGSNVTNISVSCQDTTLLVSSSKPKILTFNWAALTGATSYKLLVNPDGKSGYTQVGADTTATSMDVEVSVLETDWLHASYILEAYNGSTLISTSPILQALNVMTDVIGYFKASNTWAGDKFGYSVALSGDGATMAVGAQFESSAVTGINKNQVNDCGATTPVNCASHSGAVYIFRFSGGKWAQEAYVKASNTEANTQFGSSLALSNDGNTLVVGSPFENSASIGINGIQSNDCSSAAPVSCASSSGAAYVFSYSGGQWAQQAYVKASNTGTGDDFGMHVALSNDGNTMVTTAFWEDSSAVGVNCNGVNYTDANLNNIPDCEEADTVLSSGAAYVFVRSGTSWSQGAYIKASNSEYSDLFGWSIALSGDGNTLAVGSGFEDSSFIGISSDGTGESDNAAPASGAVYVFYKNAGIWAQQAYVKASNTGSGDEFGGQVTLSTDGSSMAVSAPYEYGNALGVNCNNNLTDLSPANNIPDCEEDNSLASSGAVYVFSRNATTWSQNAYVKASNTGANDDFGISLTLSGDGNTMAIGASGEVSDSAGVTHGSPAVANGSASYAGAVYVFRLSGGIWSQLSYVKAFHTAQGIGSAIAISASGTAMAVGAYDGGNSTGVNGDRSYDCTVSPPSNCASGSGAVLLY